MQRRTLLSLLGTSITVALAGCSDDDTEPEEDFSTPTPEQTPTPTETEPESVEAVLTDGNDEWSLFDGEGVGRVAEPQTEDGRTFVLVELTEAGAGGYVETVEEAGVLETDEAYEGFVMEMYLGEELIAESGYSERFVQVIESSRFLDDPAIGIVPDDEADAQRLFEALR